MYLRSTAILYIHTSVCSNNTAQEALKALFLVERNQKNNFVFRNCRRDELVACGTTSADSTPPGPYQVEFTITLAAGTLSSSLLNRIRNIVANITQQSTEFIRVVANLQTSTKRQVENYLVTVTFDIGGGLNPILLGATIEAQVADCNSELSLGLAQEFLPLVSCPQTSLPPTEGPTTATVVTPSLSSGESGNNNTIIIIVVVAVVILLIVVIVMVALVVIFRKKKEERRNEPTQNSNVERYQGVPSKYSTVKMSPSEESLTVLKNQLVTKNMGGETDWVIPYEDLEIGETLGKGSFGVVKSGKWRFQNVAIKFCTDIGATDDFLEEGKLMCNLRPHPNVIQIFGICVKDDCLFMLIMEYSKGGSLDTFLYESSHKLKRKQKQEIILGVCKGLLHLHSEGIIHRDLAARNVLLDEALKPKLSDFGMSRIVDSNTSAGKTATRFGPIRWMAPESIRFEYSVQSDVWSLAIVMLEVWSESEPHDEWEEKDQHELAIKIRDEALTPSMPKKVPRVYADLMRECWASSPSERPQVSEICRRLTEHQRRKKSGEPKGKKMLKDVRKQVSRSSSIVAKKSLRGSPSTKAKGDEMTELAPDTDNDVQTLKRRKKKSRKKKKSTKHLELQEVTQDHYDDLPSLGTPSIGTEKASL